MITLLILVILTAAGLYAVGLSTSGIESVSSAEQEQAAGDAAEAGLHYGIERSPDPVAERGLRLPNGARYDVAVSPAGTGPMPGYDMGWSQVRFFVRAVGYPPRAGTIRPVAEAEGVFGPVESGTEPAAGMGNPGAGPLIPVGSPSPHYRDARDPSARGHFVRRHDRRNRVLLAAFENGTLRLVDAGSTGGRNPPPGTEAPADLDRAVWTVADVRLAGPTVDGEDPRDTGWRTLVVAGVGGEKGGLFAFDVTDPRPGGPLPMRWRISRESLAMLGSARSAPAVGRIRAPSGRLDDPKGTLDRWVVLVGAEKGILVLDAATGRILQLLSHPLMGEVAASPSIAFDRQGYIDRFYAGDLSGNLWRAVVDDAGRFDPGSGPFFSIAGSRLAREIREACAVVPPEGGSGLWIYFGTENSDSLADGKAGGIFAVWDEPDAGRGADGKAGRITEADLADASPFLRKPNDPDARFPSLAGGRVRGWYGVLPTAGESLRFAPRVFFSHLFLATSIPGTRDADRGESGRIYGFGILPGTNLGLPALSDRTGSDAEREHPKAPARARKVEGGGISSPLDLTVGSRGVGRLLFRTADGRETEYEIPAPRRRKEINSFNLH